MKKKLLCLLCAGCLLLTGCTQTPSSSGGTATVTLSPAVQTREAPLDDSGLDYRTSAVVYLPGLDQQRLLAQYPSVTATLGQSKAASVVEALLDFSTTNYVSSLGNGIHLSLYGDDPVQVSGGICTVNLAATALALDNEDLYTVCMSLASTLCELDDIHHVNVLVADQAPGMDISGNLPVGSVTAHPGEELTALWEAFEGKRTPLGEDPTTVSLTSAVTLYYPLEDGTGVLPETRNLTFEGQSPQQLAAGILDALSEGAQDLSGTVSMPDISSLLVSAPLASDMLEGGRQITLSFAEGLEDTLAGYGIDLSCFIASLVLSVTTYVPSVAAMRIEIGGLPLGSLENDVLGRLTFNGGVIRRSDLLNYPSDRTEIYLSDGSGLTAAARSCGAGQSQSPRALLRLLLEGATAQEKAGGILSTLPEGFSDADILGLDYENDVLYVHLSSGLADAIRELGADREQLLCYSMVNTLCARTGASRVAFFFDGKTVDTLAGSIWWGGTFLPAYGLSGGTVG